MLTHPTLDMLRDLGLHGMVKGFQDLDAQPEARALDHGEWLAILLDNEATLRRQKRFEARARAARLRHDAQVEDADFRAERRLDRSLFLKLAGCDWIRQRHGLLITGPAGVGKSWLACALGHKACREDFSVVYHRAPRLFASLALAKGDGRYARMLKALARTDLLILDRLVHNAYRIELTGDSMRKRRVPENLETAQA
jgi:DNA replication protein DnaC